MRVTIFDKPSLTPGIGRRGGRADSMAKMVSAMAVNIERLASFLALMAVSSIIERVILVWYNNMQCLFCCRRPL